MKYACLVYIDGAAMSVLSAAEGDQLKDDSIEHDWGLRNSGRLVLAQPLDAPHTAVTVRLKDGALSSTDGPYAETKEFLGGFFIIEASNIEEARQIAAKAPILPFGSIEIRPLLDQTHSVTGEDRPLPATVG